jgi:subtilase family serine protease
MFLIRKMSMISLIGALAVAFLPSASAQDRRTLEDQIPKPVASRSVRALGRYPGSARVDVAIGLPLSDKQGLKAFIDALYDPAGPEYKRYLTPDQFTARFGASAADYQKVVDFVKSSGLTVTATTPNRMIVDVTGSVSDFERVFHFTMRTYPHPSEPRSFHAPDVEPSVPLEIPILDIMGLDDNMPPYRMGANSSPRANAQSDTTGSGPAEASNRRT